MNKQHSIKTAYLTGWTIVLLIIVAQLLSCSPKIAPSTSTNTIIRTTDTITSTVPDSTALRMLFECDSIGRVRMRELEAYKGATASQDVNFKDGELKVVTKWRTQYIDRIKEVHDTTVIDRVIEREVIREVKRVPVFFWWCFAVALISVGWRVWRVFRVVK